MLSDDGMVGRADENKAGSDGAVEVGESNAVGWNDEQYPTLCGRSGAERIGVFIVEMEWETAPFFFRKMVCHGVIRTM